MSSELSVLFVLSPSCSLRCTVPMHVYASTMPQSRKLRDSGKLPVV